MRLLSRLKWISAGILISVFCTAAGIALLYLILGNAGRSVGLFGGENLITGFFLVFVLSTQGYFSRRLYRSGRIDGLIGIWMFYPVAFAAYYAINGYLTLKAEQARELDYSAHVLAPPRGGRDRVLIELADAGNLHRRYGDDRNCYKVCAVLLKMGFVKSIAIRPGKAPRKVRVYRFRPQSVCRSIPYGERLNFPNSLLYGRGYFDGCITRETSDDYDFDVRIVTGKSLARPYGPCCQIAEFYER